MKVIIAGDFCPQDRVANLFEEEKYEEIFSEIKIYTGSADLSIVNLEAPIVNTNVAKPIVKCGPNLRCTEKAIDALKYAGFNMVTLANNHLYDFGEEGLKNTLTACKNRNLITVGAGMNLSEASKTTIQSINGKTLAIVNCCEHEFSIATESTSGCNPLNPIQQYYKIKEAHQIADYVLVIVHGGHEHYQLPSPRMKETYRFFIDAGADAVVNHHQHCYSGYEIYQGKPIFYGIGNFLFDWEGEYNSIWNEGYMVELSFEDTITYKLIPYVQCADTPTVELMIGEKMRAFESQIIKLNEIIGDDEKLNATFHSIVKQKYEGQKLVFSPYSNRYFRAMAFRGWIPSFLNNKKLLELINYIGCESHRDISLLLLQRLLK